jgi:hyperosmotically inducible protein
MSEKRGMRSRAAHRRCAEARSALAGAACGALATYFLDPHRGHGRRRQVRDRSLAAVRHARRRALHRLYVKAAYARGQARGLAHRLRHARPRALDDATLAHKVESIVFRDRRLPKGRVNVSAESGAVVLRGELDSPELIEDLERAVRAVPGVREVESRLHLPEGLRRPRKRKRTGDGSRTRAPARRTPR